MRVPIAEQSAVGSGSPARRIFAHLPEYAPPRCGPEHPVMRKMNPAEEIDSRSVCLDEYLTGMKREFQPPLEKIRHCGHKIFQILLAIIHDHKIIGVANAIANFQFTFQKLIKFIHINIHKELARKIPERQTNTGTPLRMKAVDDFAKEPKNIVIPNMPLQNFF